MKKKRGKSDEPSMPTLRITQTVVRKDEYRVEVALEATDLPRQTATANFKFKLTAQDQEDMRWYLEDYLQHPHDPAPKIAARIEKRMSETGIELFKAVFQSSDDARDLWATFRTRLNDTRVEIVTGVQEASSVPWELIRDPKTDTPLALHARAFVRGYSQPAQTPRIPETETGPIRILLVICRPGGGKDVPFRSVAARLIKGLGRSTGETFRLDVLRPPTFERLATVLREAKSRDEPYHVVHFDGHGTYANVKKPGVLKKLLDGLSPLLLSSPRDGTHGYLLFENPVLDDNMQLVDGPALGRLLAETDVPVLVLNACRSAHAEAPAEPGPAAADPHAEVRALGSLAQEVMDAGVGGVVAMRYNVYVVTAAQLVANLYAALAQGHSLGEAVSLGRKQLHDQPLRTIAYDPVPLQDWSVSVVYEAAPISLFPRTKAVEKPEMSFKAGEAMAAQGKLDPKLPPTPDAGFFGRDETLLALDRAFDTQSIVLLHAYAGSGKTATATEFARWYALTGGIKGPVLFTSFERYRPLARVLDRIGEVFGPMLEAAGVNWLALPDDERRQMALQVLKQVPVLWIWDNVEPITGFPAGTDSAWSKEEQKELVDFLRAARGTRAKFLLTSRRDERIWLGELPRRITVSPMPMLERVQLARALAEKYGHRLTDVEDWRPLLEFTRGNPLTVTVLVGQALRGGLNAKEQIKDFVSKLRAGEAAFEDEESEGREKSLGASLSYGFEHAFNEEERKQLALLHFFQGFVDVNALKLMGDSNLAAFVNSQTSAPGDFECLSEVSGLTCEDGIVLLDRAAEIGLLTSHGGGYYSIHPALPWYFRDLFEKYYRENQEKAARAFVEAMGALGDYYYWQYEGGNREVIAALTTEEANLLHARELARTHGWWGSVVGTMQGLRVLYNHTGRRAEWKQLVEEIVPDFVNQDDDGPLLGREDDWSLLTHYRVSLLREARKWTEAECLQRILMEWDRKNAAPALAVLPGELDSAQRNAIRSLAASLHEIGQIQSEQGKPECVKNYEKSLTLSEQIDEQVGSAVSALQLGHAYKDLPAIQNLAQAEHWYMRSLDFYDKDDRLGRAMSLGQLGLVAYERFKEAKAADKPEEELLQYINNALTFHHKALEMFPSNVIDQLAVTHNALAAIYYDAGDHNHTLPHYSEAIRYFEAAGDIYRAAGTRFNVALALVRTGRLEDALEYAGAALRNYETYGDRAAEDIKKTQRLIEIIERLQEEKTR